MGVSKLGIGTYRHSFITVIIIRVMIIMKPTYIRWNSTEGNGVQNAIPCVGCLSNLPNILFVLIADTICPLLSITCIF